MLGEIPSLFYCSIIGNHAFMIMEALDYNLENLLNLEEDNKFILKTKTVLMIAEQIVKIFIMVPKVIKNLIHA